MPEQDEVKDPKEDKIDKLVDVLVEEYPELLSDILGTDIKDSVDAELKGMAKKEEIRRKMKELLKLLMEREDTKKP